MTFLGFLIPVEAGERIGYMVSLVLAMTFFTVQVQNELPRTENTSWLGKFFIFLWSASLAFTLIATCLVSRPLQWLCHRFFRRRRTQKDQEEDIEEERRTAAKTDDVELVEARGDDIIEGGTNDPKGVSTGSDCAEAVVLVYPSTGSAVKKTLRKKPSVIIPPADDWD